MNAETQRRRGKNIDYYSLCLSVSAFILKLWRLIISPLLGNNCRYYPSCSHYMEQSLIEHGFFRGGFLGFLRICRCNSLYKGGYDPVKGKNDKR